MGLISDEIDDEWSIVLLSTQIKSIIKTNHEVDETGGN